MAALPSFEPNKIGLSLLTSCTGGVITSTNELIRDQNECQIIIVHTNNRKAFKSSYAVCNYCTLYSCIHGLHSVSSFLDNLILCDAAVMNMASVEYFTILVACH